jgi:hypothetical protein
MKSEIEHYMQLVGQLRRQAEIDTAALNRLKQWKAEATEVMTHWDEVWAKVPHGVVGSFKWDDVSNEIERLGDDLENAYRLIRERHDTIDRERALSDDLATVLRKLVQNSADLDALVESRRVMAHYREARG